ncbi:MAG: hypothetical protein II723_07865 [Oscillospiraceae bacterium]|nr:hypothetical protein [Oscillospiraceae bacterium]
MADGYVVLDTKVFDTVIRQSGPLVQQYREINEEYDEIVRELLDIWKGEGADAFRQDAYTVKSNISGIYDILKIMCDTLTDCRAIFGEADAALGEYNRNMSVGG